MEQPRGFWVDAQLPPRLASWLMQELSVRAGHIEAVGLRDAKDHTIFAAARAARIRVSDSGRGIAEDKLESIFEPFVQVDRHLMSESQQGVGLGLAISRELARAMGGDLSAESTLGVGSAFTLSLPCSSPSETGCAESAPRISGAALSAAHD